MVFPQELRSLVALAGGFELVQWFFGFKPHLGLERARHPLLMVVVLRKNSRAGPGRRQARRGRQRERHGRTVLRRGADSGSAPVIPGSIGARSPTSGRWAPACGRRRRRGGRFLGRGFYNPRPRSPAGSSRGADEPVDGASSSPPRGRARPPRRRAGRRCACLCWSEADGLPGLVVDRYGPVSVLQCLTLGMARTIGGSPLPSASLSRRSPSTGSTTDGGPHRGLRAAPRLDRAGPDRRGGRSRGRRPVRRDAGRRPQDGPLSRPARQPRRRGGPRRGARARRVLLHGRLRLRGARGRRGPARSCWRPRREALAGARRISS